MIEQSHAGAVHIEVDSVLWPAVTGISIRGRRTLTAAGTADPSDTVYTVTVKRYFPVGLEVKDFTPLRDFSVTVSDCWNTYYFTHCEWAELEREATEAGVTETAVLTTRHAQVV